MRIGIDIGNTDIVIGVYDGESWIHHWRTPSQRNRPEAAFNEIVKNLFLENAFEIESVESIALSSVVPDLTQIIQNVFESLVGLSVVVIHPENIEKLALGDVINPYQIGSDLVCNAVGAFDRFGQNTIVVDFGTALTFTSINDQGNMMGVAIAPGVRTAMKSLSANTAKLPEIPLEIPNSVVGTDTISAMQSGIMQGYVGLVRHMVNETKKHHAHPPKVIATGGLSFVFEPLHDVFDEIDVHLTLNGLLVAAEKLR
ncbi:type III pantothenate kinase [Reichenbachiella versicolor]|uniref:type III pantothenate kinase n=1 Tax=Reichenbachiella versicolor TaxID=1821036 RepID=UPI000D6E15C0|nr:type III pantothenate kinase [Reichenbachiella versicolor]